MNAFHKCGKPSVLIAGIAVALLVGCANMAERMETRVNLSGVQEVPPVNTGAAGYGNINVNDSTRSIGGSVTTKGLVGTTAAHIHEGAAGTNGPVIIPLTRASDEVWAVPAGAVLTESQFKSYKAGNLYINVHTEKYKGGEIRGQLKDR